MTPTVNRPAHPSYEWRPQPDGISCGPTCIAMARDGLARGLGMPEGPGVPAIAAMCGTNTRTGTTHEGVAVALPGLGLDGARVTGRGPFRAAFAAAMDRGDPVLLRTLTHGCKHWVLAAGRDAAGRVALLDPGGGRRAGDAAEVERLVAPRDHEIWVVDRHSRPRRIEVASLGGAERLRGEAMAILRPEFEGLLEGMDLAAYLDGRVDWGLSRGLLVDGRLAGAYLLRERGLDDEMPEAGGGPLGRLRAAEGVALAVAPDLRGRGYGRLLRDQPRVLGFGLVWGLQDKALGNLERWLRRRRLVGESGKSWVTAEVLPPPGHRAVADPGAAYGP